MAVKNGSDIVGTEYPDATVICREGDRSESMYVIQEGKVDLTRRTPEGEVHIATLGPGEIFGEMELFSHLPRFTTATASGRTRILTIQGKKFLSSISKDPSIALRTLESMSERMLKIYEELAKIRNAKFEILRAAIKIDSVCELILEDARKAVKADRGSIMLLDRDGRNLRIAAGFGQEWGEKVELKVGDGIAGKVIQTGQAQVISNISRDPLFVKPGAGDIGSLVCVPLIYEGRKLGVLNLSSTEENAFTMHDMKLIQVLTSCSTVAIQNALTYQELKETTEELTKAMQTLRGGGSWKNV